MPYVVCDPILTTGIQPTKYVLTIDGGASFEVDPQTLGDGSKRLRYDVTAVTTGTHNMTVAAKNLWGQSSTTPFSFTKSVPTAPTNIGLEV